jgi:SAM-dependent methyltransferase
VWREAFRVLRPGGLLLAAFANPVVFLFDRRLEDRGIFTLRHAAPYSDLESLGAEERRELVEAPGDPYAFGHSLEEQLGGQLAAGFVLTGLYEDHHVEGTALNAFLPAFVATRAVRPG